MMLVKLRFVSPLHTGTRGSTMEEVEDIIHSDTIYSALMHASLELFGEPIGDIKLSSAFPFVDDLLFFPKPLLRFASAVQGDGYMEEHRKDLKTLSFVVESSFRQWLFGEAVDLERMLNASKALGQSIQSDLRPRVTLDRQEVSSQLYFIGHIAFAPGSGLFCLVDTEETDEEKLKALWRYLGDQGIGGERSSGYGQFVPEFGTWNGPEPEHPVRYVTLSLSNLTGDQTRHLVSYRLTHRGGWIWSPASRKTARRCNVGMVLEGSVFDAKVEGRICDVTPPDWDGHRVLRYGKAFLLGAGDKN